MNTTDVRDMERSQWLYWAVAVPVTAAVVFLGLLWTGELGNIMQWVQSFGSRQPDNQPLSDDRYYEPNTFPLRRRTPPPLAPLPRY